MLLNLSAPLEAGNRSGIDRNQNRVRMAKITEIQGNLRGIKSSWREIEERLSLQPLAIGGPQGAVPAATKDRQYAQTDDDGRTGRSHRFLGSGHGRQP
ncbi:hypothetical protein SPHV1_710012 [Novosphingobium sp. KN65.2]|nr:hypothetical protein SPHV1_710012 [Novosphingobium sp. KN65.2]